VVVDLPKTPEIVVGSSENEGMKGFEGRLEEEDHPEEDQDIDKAMVEQHLDQEIDEMVVEQHIEQEADGAKSRV